MATAISAAGRSFKLFHSITHQIVKAATLRFSLKWRSDRPFKGNHSFTSFSTAREVGRVVRSRVSAFCYQNTGA